MLWTVVIYLIKIQINYLFNVLQYLKKAKMGNKTLQEKLKDQAESDSSRSATARLRDVFDDVEAAIAAGVKHNAIRKTLSESGLNFTKSSFIDALNRIRKNKGAVKKPAPKNSMTKTVTENKSPATATSRGTPGKFVFNSNPDTKDLI